MSQQDTLPLLSGQPEFSTYGTNKSLNNHNGNPSPEETASSFSRLTISWMSPMFKIGYNRQLQEADIYEMLSERRTQIVGPKFQGLWDQERQNAALEGRPPSLIRAMFWFSLPYYWFAQVAHLIADNISRLIPFIVLWIIEYIQDSQEESKTAPTTWKIYGLSVMLLLTSLLQVSLQQIWVRDSETTGILLRTALIEAIFKKATIMSSKARLEYPDGAIFNLMSSDTSRIDEAIEAMFLLVSVPLSCMIATGMLVYLMGPSALLGTIFLMVSNPAQARVMSRLNPIRKKVSKLVDTRLHLVTEAILGIKIIKYFSYESSFLKRVSEIRNSELKYVALLMQVRGFVYSISSPMPMIASALTFVLYAYLGNELKPQIVFPAMTIFVGLRIPLLVLPYVYNNVSDLWVSTKRIEKFLQSSDSPLLSPIVTSHRYALSIKNANFSWDQLPSRSEPSNQTKNHEQQPLLSDNTNDNSNSVSPPFLQDINLNIERGSLVAIVGPVGSGKSSLLQAIIGAMPKGKGEVIRGGTISYASQTPWIRNASIRDNILFNTPFDEERYWRAVNSCSLKKDLSNMPFGDLTEIGERGVNLSGGQKARLSISRCVYYNADIVVMDDPLSAVDAHVGKRLWRDCILKELSKKTRIIATHQLHILSDVDYVIYMDHGRIIEQGSFQNLMSNEHGSFYSLMTQYGGSQGGKTAEQSSGAATDDQVIDDSTESDGESLENSSLKDNKKKNTVSYSQMTEEERSNGAISTEVYLRYFKLGGYYTWAVVIFLAVIQQAIGICMNLWLSYWTSDKFNLSMWTYIEVYLGTGLLQLVAIMIGSYALVTTVIKSSRLMYNEAFHSILRAPVSFFDTTPMGRILNRLSKDINTMDNTLLGAINSLLVAGTGILGILALASFLLPLIIPVVIPMIISYVLLGIYFQRTSRELQRINALLRSHLYSHFSETLSGMTTLKAYHQHGINNAIVQNQQNLDRSNKAYYHLLLGKRWNYARAFSMGIFLNFIASLVIVWYRHDISPSIAGLVLSYLSMLSQELNFAVQCFGNVENNMNSAERILYYCDNLEQEPPAEIPDRKPSVTWPSQGKIIFKNVSMRYRSNLPLALDNVSFDVLAGQKIGVVGRTGAGKSSLIQALFRLVELESGFIIIDDIETHTIGTVDLRSKIAIIPQDPVLFQGTVRYNLDPLSRYTDNEIWEALETTGMKDYVQLQEGGLDSLISAHGENLSVGQRQLICLSRALITKSKVVVLDEATASVDLATDKMIQRAIRVNFFDSTVITIAHRINTVVDYHRILVMDQGHVAEYDTPSNLLRDPDSAFSKMVDETGESNAAMLRSLTGC